MAPDRPGLAYIAEQGAALPLMDYLAAVKLREAMGQKMAAFLQQWDLLLTPTMPIPAFAAGHDFRPTAIRRNGRIGRPSPIHST